MSKTDKWPERCTCVREDIDIRGYLSAGYTIQDLENAMALLIHRHDNIIVEKDPRKSEFITTLKFGRGAGKSILPVLNEIIDAEKSRRELICRLTDEGKVVPQPTFLLEMERRVLNDTFGLPAFLTQVQQKPVDCSKYIIMEKTDDK